MYRTLATAAAVSGSGALAVKTALLYKFCQYCSKANGTRCQSRKPANAALITASSRGGNSLQVPAVHTRNITQWFHTDVRKANAKLPLPVIVASRPSHAEAVSLSLYTVIIYYSCTKCIGRAHT